jgi:hypothetical protein
MLKQPKNQNWLFRSELIGQLSKAGKNVIPSDWTSRAERPVT